MEVAKQKTDRKTSYLSIYLFYYLFILFFFFFFFCIFAHCAINCFRWPVLFCDSFCKWTELSGSCLFYEIKCSRLAFKNRSCLNEAGNYPAASCAIGANTGK